MTVRLARWSWLLLVLCGMAAVAHAENNNCGDPPDPSHYIAQSGDTEDAQHFAVDRTFTGQGKLEFNMCSGGSPACSLDIGQQTVKCIEGWRIRANRVLWKYCAVTFGVYIQPCTSNQVRRDAWKPLDDEVL